jgi:UDP-N-acetylmuramoyl-tripeptide--D-alanyl-D-alanine ligase
MKNFAKKIIIIILTFISKGILLRYKPKIVAVTGNLGKTSTKDAIYIILKNEGTVRRSEKSFNGDFGVPLSIIGVKSGWGSIFAWIQVIFQGLGKLLVFDKTYPKTLVLEIGADKPGDISSIAKWLKPDVVVITHLPEIPVHIEFFPTLESIVEEKISLARNLKKEGILVLNGDDEKIMKAKEKLPFRSFTFGQKESVDIRASNIQIQEPSDIAQGGLNFKIDFDGKTFPVNLPHVYSEGYVSVALAAISVAYATGMNMITAISEIKNYETPPGRSRLIPGQKGSIIIDDTYNSSPAACEAGLVMLKNLPFGKRKIAVIGDMLELGKYTIEAHEEIGKVAKKCANLLVTVGVRAKGCVKGATEEGMSEKKILELPDAVSAAEALREILKAGDVVYVKGSQGMRMERIVKVLMAEPEKAGELLVRQEPEWLK